MGEEDGGNVLLGLIPGFGQGFQQAREAKKKDAYLAAQTDLIKQEAKLKEKALVIESMKEDIFGKMTPEQQMRALYPKAEGEESFKEMLKTFGMNAPGGVPAATPAAPFGGGSSMFPLDPSVTAAPSFSQQAASLLSPKPEFSFDSTGKIIVKMNQQKTRRRDVEGPEGRPVSILETEEGVGIPGGALPVPVKLEERKRKLPDGTEISYDVDPYTGRPAGVGVTPKSGTPYRVSAPAPVEEFKYTDPTGTEYSVIRNKQTGANVTTPVPVAPMKGTLATEGGKIEGITKGLENVKKIRSKIMNKDGSVNRALILKMWAPMGGIGEGRQMNSLFREALDVKIRFMTGAAISKEELPFYESTYLPHPLDSDELIVDKLNRQEQFLQGAGAAVDPSGISAGRVKKATGKPPVLGKEKPKGRFEIIGVE